MLEINSKNIRFLSRLGARGVLGQALYDMACEGKAFFAVSADLSKAAGYDRLEKKYPEKCVNTGIAEQSMIGTAAGLAQMGTPVYVSSWAVFSTLRIADQMRNYMGNMKSNIKLIGMDSGLTKSSFGISHSNPQDIALFRSQPNLRIIAPSDGVSIYKLLEQIQEDDIPTYVRLTGGDTLPMIYKNDIDISLDKAVLIKEGSDVAIIATGAIVNEAIKAAEILEENGISTEVIDCHTIKPFDDEILYKQLDKKLIVTLEEHSIYGGLGGLVAERLAVRVTHPELLILGIRDEIVASQLYNEALEEYGLTGRQIYQKIKEKLELNCKH